MAPDAAAMVVVTAQSPAVKAEAEFPMAKAEPGLNPYLGEDGEERKKERHENVRTIHYLNS